MEFRREPNPEYTPDANRFLVDLQAFMDTVEPLEFDGRSRLFVVPRLALSLHDVYTPTTAVTLATDYDSDDQARPLPGDHFVIRTCELGVEGEADSAYLQLAHRCFSLPQMGSWFWRETTLRPSQVGGVSVSVAVREGIERRMIHQPNPARHRMNEMWGEFIDFKAKQQLLTIDAEIRILREVLDMLRDAS